MNPETFNEYAIIFFFFMMCGGFIPLIIAGWWLQGWLERIRENDFNIAVSTVEDLPEKGDFLSFSSREKVKVIKIYKKTLEFKVRPIK